MGTGARMHCLARFRPSDHRRRRSRPIRAAFARVRLPACPRGRPVRTTSPSYSPTSPLSFPTSCKRMSFLISDCSSQFLALFPLGADGRSRTDGGCGARQPGRRAAGPGRVMASAE